ncbi:MAG: hypothetical protein WAP47_06500 [Candidatus Rokuibacteriota bacterium]
MESLRRCKTVRRLFWFRLTILRRWLPLWSGFLAIRSFGFGWVKGPERE